ncbi:MAG TPA: RNA polymerase sigma factor [Gemmatimonadales bacterium]|nr:RNA polymerase sigma factor [Gemmatimonadales bacterium]
MEHTIAALVARAQSGDVNAFGALMAQFRSQFGRYAWQMLGTREEAEEVLQDTFLRAYRALSTCRDPERFGAWAFRILVNRCRSSRRRLLNRDRFRAPDHTGLEYLSAPAPEEDHELRESIDRALALLPPAQREAFLLKHVEGLSYGEIAELTGAGIPALKMRVLRACEALRVSLEGEPHG